LAESDLGATDAAFDDAGVENAKSSDHIEDERAIMAWASALATAWNKHDAKALAGAFADDATLNGASGGLARGRSNIEKLFEEEQATSMKATTFTWTRTQVTFLKQDAAMFDGDCDITGVTGADGKPVPLSRFRVSAVLAKKAQRWTVQPCLFIPLPGSVAGTPATVTPSRKQP
jgi:uncharacterized protein (TIGR02246 family)